MTIFVGGIHGVGKSTLCSLFVESRGGEWIHLSAGELIRKESDLLNADCNSWVNVEHNQQLLLRALRTNPFSHRRVMLDGHFVLRNQDGALTPVSEYVFKELKLTGVILVEANPDLIVSRLQERSGLTYSIDDVAVFLKMEKTQAEKICSSLHLPFQVVMQPSVKEFAKIVDTFGFFCDQNVTQQPLPNS